MKKKIAIMISIILMAGIFTACTAEEKMDNSSLSHTVSTSVGVSVSGETSAMATTETTIPEKADSGKNSAVVSATDPIQKTQTEVRNNSKNTVNSNQSESESTAKKETETPTQKPAVKPTQPITVQRNRQTFLLCLTFMTCARKNI